MSRNRLEYLRIGEIVRSHGVHGDVKVLPLTDDPARFRALTEAFVERDGRYAPVQTGGVRLQPGAALLHIAGCDTPEAAETYKGAFLCVDRAHAVTLPEDSYFDADLIGCETFDTEGRAFGRVTDVLETGANDVYEIEGGKLLVPALKKVFVSVDTEGKRIVFDAAVLREVGLFAD